MVTLPMESLGLEYGRLGVRLRSCKAMYGRNEVSMRAIRSMALPRGV